MYQAQDQRYDNMVYRRLGRSGLKLSAISLGLWHNFGDDANERQMREMICTAFDHGITVFDLANNYGPEAGSAERNFGRILKQDLAAYRDEMIITSKAGFYMWPGPYGEWGSRKYLLASLDQSLKRLGLDYVDIFYHHRPDPDTPLEESLSALDQAVRQGKALYVGLSNYNKAQTEEALAIFRRWGTPFVISQPSYSLLNRWIETDGLRDFAQEEGFGLTAYSPLSQGLLSNRYLNGVPEDSRAAGQSPFLQRKDLTPNRLETLHRLADLAEKRGQTLAQMALAWVLREEKVDSVLIGASRPAQILENLAALEKLDFGAEELAEIDRILAQEKSMPGAGEA